MGYFDVDGQPTEWSEPPTEWVPIEWLRVGDRVGPASTVQAISQDIGGMRYYRIDVGHGHVWKILPNSGLRVAIPPRSER